jgi:glycerol uptake facilitator-like aquaporin
MRSIWRVYVTECIGTAAVVLFTSGAVCLASLPGMTENPTTARMLIALMAGLSWAMALAFTVRISGGFLNPVLTLTLWVFQRLEDRRAGGLIVAQLFGASLAGLALRGVFFVNEEILVASRMGTPHLNHLTFNLPEVNRTAVLLGIGIEAILAFLLTFAVFVFIYDSRFRQRTAHGLYRLSYLWLGIAVTLATLLAFDFTGAGLNPARWFGTIIWESTVEPLVVFGPWKDHAPYWIGPIAGSLLGGGVYTYAVLPPDTPPGPFSEGMP